MNRSELLDRLHSLVQEEIPLPGGGDTWGRHRRLLEIGREDLSLARLAEAHWDAVAILAEAGLHPEPGAIYGVWASEIPGRELRFEQDNEGFGLSGTKLFCSGAGLIDRALVTAGSEDQRLLNIDLRRQRGTFHIDDSAWKTGAFSETKTAAVTFTSTRFTRGDIVGGSRWYLDRPGFWHGACGPAACWAGGAVGLVDYARRQSRSDPHTKAHLGAMTASAWALNSFLETAGREIDMFPEDVIGARICARTVRHLVEQASTDILRRLPRAYGPHPLVMDEGILRRYQELDIYLRQSHAERDLEALGGDIASLSEDVKM
jgi:alkylation response protein AidB-like acyl-CoA dehydrogenase